MVQFDETLANNKLKELRSMSEERAIKSLAPQLGYPYIYLVDLKIDPEAIILVKESVAKEAEVAGFDLNKQTLSLAVKNPNSPKTKMVIADLQALRYEVMVYMCSTASLEFAWKRYEDYHASSSETQGVMSVDSKRTEELISYIKRRQDVATKLKEIGDSNNTMRISETLSLIFAGSLALKASDIHIEPEETGIRLRYRLDGVLHDVVDLDTYIYKRLMSRLKLLSGMVLNVKSEAQDGRFTFDFGDSEVEVRSSVIPGSFGESIVMRILDPNLASFKIENLDLNKKIKSVLDEQLKKPNGLILTTGPTGSGKTTALYAFLREVHNESKKIITIENPVEYKLEGIVHTQTDKDYTFSKGLRAILRQDPDVIMVGEIRDKEVAETAIHAAQTGHLVFSTLHTNSAISAFTRLLDLKVNPNSLRTSINVILGQRLVRKLCVECRQPYSATQQEADLIKMVMTDHPEPKSIDDPITLYRSAGCPACGNTGFKGRVGVFEAVIMDDKLEEVIVRDPREQSLREAAKGQGIPSMLEDGIDKVLVGDTSIFELQRVVEFPLSVNEVQIKEKNLPVSNLKEEVGLDEDFKSHVVN
jgi:type IV pilus assembly protein PilB